MTQYSFYFALLFATLIGTLCGAENRPNVLILFADDQRADTIAALGNPNIKTPNLDRLVSRGLSFDRAYMQGGLNGATCVPSRAMLLSGRSLFRVDEKLQRDETWPAAFGRQGYTTFISGKWHNGAKSIPMSFQQAKSIFDGGMTDPLKAKLSDVVDGKLAPSKLASKHACEVFADEAIKFIQEKHDNPFFCYVPFDAPHDPHIVPDDFSVSYSPDAIPVPSNFLAQHPWDNGEMVIRDEELLDWPRDPKKIQLMLAEYYRYISYLDSQIGRILDVLESSPHAKNTLVVFAADSGVARGSHGLIGKQNCYEHSMRVPLVISGPGISAGKRTQSLCYLFDLLPTIGELCKVDPPKTSEGVRFTNVLTDPQRPIRKEIVLGYKSVQRAICDDRWKLIRYPQVNETQLFDLQTDPQEIKNLAEQSEYQPIVSAMMTRLQAELVAMGEDKPILEVENPKSSDWTPPKRK